MLPETSVQDGLFAASICEWRSAWGGIYAVRVFLALICLCPLCTNTSLPEGKKCSFLRMPSNPYFRNKAQFFGGGESIWESRLREAEDAGFACAPTGKRTCSLLDYFRAHMRLSIPFLFC